MNNLEDIKQEILTRLGDSHIEACLHMVYIDLDLFVYHNDAFGHARGDVALGKIAWSLAELARKLAESDKQSVIGSNAQRVGADEFLLYIITKNCEQELETGNMVQDCINELDIPYVSTNYTAVDINGQIELPVRLPFSVATLSSSRCDVELSYYFPLDSDLIDKLCGLLETEIVVAKQSGRNHIVEVKLPQS